MREIEQGLSSFGLFLLKAIAGFTQLLLGSAQARAEPADRDCE